MMKNEPTAEVMPKKADEKKVDQPWTDHERSFIVTHVLTHVLANAGYANIFGELSEILVKEGYPARGTKAYRDQWNRKIAKDLLAIYGNKDTAALKTPTKASSAAKAPASPTKRKRKDETEMKATKQEQH